MNNDYTVEVYKVDKRYKNGIKLWGKFDFVQIEEAELERMISSMYAGDNKFTWKIFNTYVTRKNLLTGEPFQERYDTPYYCSPSSETFWSS
jgi:hypothetical protein